MKDPVNTLNKLDKQDLHGVIRSLRRLLAKLRRRFRDLVKREKAVAERESALTDRENAVAKREKAVSQKVAAFDQFLADYQEPSAGQQANIYLLNVQNNVVKPARELYEAVKGVDDEKQAGAPKAPELTIKQDLGKGRSR